MAAQMHWGAEAGVGMEYDLTCRGLDMEAKAHSVWLSTHAPTCNL